MSEARPVLPLTAEEEAEYREHFLDGSGAYTSSLDVARLLRTLDREREREAALERALRTYVGNHIMHPVPLPDCETCIALSDLSQLAVQPSPSLARIEYVNGNWYAICPECGVHVALHERKDEESFTKREYIEHFALLHSRLR